MISKGCCLAMEMGVGKTLTVIAAAEILFCNSLINNVLVIAPLSIVDVWNQELNKHSSYSEWSILIGSKDKRVTILNNDGSKSKLQWSIINIDGLSVIESELSKKKFDMIVVDESTIIKNRNAHRTKLVIKLFQSFPYKIIMSGNPSPKSPDEIFSQYNFVEPGVFGSSYYSFREKYFLVDYFNKIIGYKNEKEFTEKFHSIAFRKTKQECLDLPPKVYQNVFVEMSKEQSKIYKAMEKDALAHYEDLTCAAPVVIAKFVRLSQIAGGFFPSVSGGGKYILPNAKMERLLELVLELPKDEQIVIWARFQKEIELIKSSLEKLGIDCVSFYGKTSVQDRNKARELFREKKVRVFIGNPATGGKGLNDLVGATTVIYYSNDYSAENKQQSEDRNHRNGTVKVTYIDLLTKDTIDVNVLEVLRNNRDFSNMLLNRTVKFS